MGEAQKLTAEESLTVVRRVVSRAAGRVPIVVGVSSAGLAPLVPWRTPRCRPARPA